MLLKSPRVQIMDRMVEVRYRFLSDGQLIQRNCCQRPAPSTDAASYRSFGMASRPVTRMSVQNGSDFQMWTAPAMENAIQRSLSQFGPSTWKSLKMRLLTRPHSGFSMKRKERMVGMEGTAQGRMNITDSTRIQVRSCTKKPDRKSASRNLTLTTTSTKSSVLSTA